MSIKFPLGLDNFAKIREGNFYYVDKTEFISELLSNEFEANLITRPRRFGKTLMMSMLEDFFDISRDSRTHFKGLKILEEKELCRKWMNQYPVIFFTLKDVEGLNFQNAYGMLKALISNICKKFAFLEQSQSVDVDDIAEFQLLKAQKADIIAIKNSLLTLTRMMMAYYRKPVILLIDEYDVPLSVANNNGYYREMLDIIRAIISTSLKTNPYLKFAVVTGCLRISKESIFTGTNHFVPNSITDDRFCEHIGFTETDIQKLLSDTGFSDHEANIKEWYNGYHFGNIDVYCPWDVLNYMNDLQVNPTAQPKAYWINTSGNAILKKFFRKSSRTTKMEIEKLIAGESIKKKLNDQLTYNELDQSIDNLWSLLYLTGYLTAKNIDTKGNIDLVIPNLEIHKIFTSQISEWFTETKKYCKIVCRTEITR